MVNSRVCVHCFPFTHILNQYTVALTPIGVLIQNMFGYIEVTSVYSGENCSHWYTLGVGSVSCGSIMELVWIFLLMFGWCYFKLESPKR